VKNAKLTKALFFVDSWSFSIDSDFYKEVTDLIEVFVY